MTLLAALNWHSIAFFFFARYGTGADRFIDRHSMIPPRAVWGVGTAIRCCTGAARLQPRPAVSTR